MHPPQQRPDLEPLPVDVPRHIRIGILAWLLALAVLLPFTAELRASGHLWWLGTCATGVGLGLIGLFYLRGRDDASGNGGSRERGSHDSGPSDGRSRDDQSRKDQQSR